MHVSVIAWAGEADSPRGSSLSRSLLDTRGAQKAMPSSRSRSRSQRLEHEKTACNSNQWTPHDATQRVRQRARGRNHEHKLKHVGLAPRLFIVCDT